MNSTESDTSNSPGTNPTKTGLAESSPKKNSEERLEELDKILDEYEHSLGIPGVGEDEVTQEARRLVKLPPGQLRKMSALECGEASYILRQFAHRLQQAVNRQQARMTWAEESIKAIIAKTINNYRGISFEERKLQAVRDNEAATKLDVIRVHAKLRIDRVSFLSAKAGDMAMTLMSIQATKRGRHEE